MWSDSRLGKEYIALFTLIRREVNRIMRIWIQSLLPYPITMILYFVIFGSLIGPRIGELDGFTYMSYITPGIIMMGVINNSYSNTVSSFFGLKFQNTIEENLVSPMSSLSILLGFITGGIVRGFLVGLIIIAISLFFVRELHIYSFSITILVALLTAFFFSLAGLINGIFARKFDDISIVPTFILTPLTYLGGVFYSVNMLPEFWQKVSYLNPILYLVNAFRYGMLGVSDIDIGFSILAVCFASVILFSFCWHLLEKGHGLRH